MALLKKKTTKKTEKKAAPAKEVKVKAPVVSSDSIADAYRVIVRPLMTEKTTRLESLGQYSFEVAIQATKVDVKRAVKAIYGVLPAKVRMVNMDGKRLRFKSRKGTRKHWKKAVVSVPKGTSIEIHTGV